VANVLAIVGAGPGLGSALAKRFAREGWSIGLVARRADVLDASRAELEEFGVATQGAVADVVDAVAVERALTSIVEALGVPSVVVYNASIYQAESALELTREALDTALDVHVVGALNTAQSAVAAMQEADRGVLVFTVNNMAVEPEATSTALSIGKGAQLNLALSLDQELDDSHIDIAIVTVAGAIKEGTALDPERIANVYWDLAQQDPGRFRRDHLIEDPG
jgi:NADP-dependent 3-hydroxy acid dehydrogenase YdfG